MIGAGVATTLGWQVRHPAPSVLVEYLENVPLVRAWPLTHRFHPSLVIDRVTVAC